MGIIKVEPAYGNEEGMLTIIFLFEHVIIIFLNNFKQ